MKFSIEKRLANSRGRIGNIETEHGAIQTPAFIVVGTKGTVKSLTVEQLYSIGVEAVLANTYHLYLQPGDKIIRKAGGLQDFMNWHGPSFTDSGGFQAFSLGVAYGNEGVSKIVGKTNSVKEHIDSRIQEDKNNDEDKTVKSPLVKIDEEGIDFKSIIDGSSHRFTPERSIEIQHNIGADIIFAFDECTSPLASYEYQKEAMDRTHRWARRSSDFHKKNNKYNQALFGIVQGGRYQDLRKESAEIINKMDFDGYGIGGSFDKEDIYSAVGWVNDILDENKPRHLLGIGEPVDLFGGIENGIDTFDCVTPTRIARNGNLYTENGKINILNAKYKEDYGKFDINCRCYTCMNYSTAYLSHLFRAKEMLASTLASIHNLYFIVNLVKNIRKSILDDNFYEYKKVWLSNYYNE